MAEPIILDNVFPKPLFDRLVSVCKRRYKQAIWNEDFGRWGVSTEDETADGTWLKPYATRLLPKAKEIFKSPELDISYIMFAQYETEKANLPKHKDNNACTYTLDVCLYYDTPWAIWVEGKEYWLKPNQALVFYGEDQLHWREEFPVPENNKVGMLFNHYIEPDHWWYTGQRIIDGKRQ